MVRYFYPEISFKAHFVDSKGDKDKNTSLRGLEKTNFFTDTLDTAILEGSAQVALHSAKDLPDPLPKGLVQAALTPCIDSRDAVVFADHISLDSSFLCSYPLKIATSSKRREEAVRDILPQATFCDLRGTIEERLRVIETGIADGVVLAEAALIRLNMTHLPRIYLPGKTTSGQGSLAIVVREDQQALIELFSILDIRQGRPLCLYLGIDPSPYQKKCPFPLKHLPLIETINFLETDPKLSLQARDAFLKASHIIITSPRSAAYLGTWLHQQKITSYAPKQWWCMGQASSLTLKTYIENQPVKECPIGSSAEAMIPWIHELSSSSFVFFPHSLLARPLLKEALESCHIPHLDLAIYTTTFKKVEDWPSIHHADELIFSSPSCVQSLYSQGAPSRLTLLRSIGPVTELALQKYKHHRYTAGTAL
jgi:hydroxymethylbilane synthase